MLYIFVITISDMAVGKKASYFSGTRPKLMLTAVFVYIGTVLLFTYFELIHVVGATIGGYVGAGGLFVLAAVIGIIGWYTREKKPVAVNAVDH
jgi:hypothetical protein